MRSIDKCSILLATALSGCAILAPAHAARVTVVFQAEVTSVVDNQGVLAGRIKVGDIVDGEYTYDTDGADSVSSPDMGYFAQPSTEAIGMVVNQFGFQSMPTGGYNIRTVDNTFPGKHDQLNIHAIKGEFDLAVPDATLNYMALDFEDGDGTTLSSDALPSITPPLSAWALRRSLFISSSRGGTSPAEFRIQGRITFVETLPPPAE